MIYRLALIAALCGTAWVGLRHLFPAAGFTARAALTAALSFVLTVAIPVGMHYAGLRVTAANLALGHGLAFLAAFVLTRRKVVPGVDRNDSGIRLLVLMALPLAFLLFPFTRLAGIDTYRWQILASMVQVEQRVPWLVHPAGLLGFTPYGYPVGHPLLLATVNLLSGLGVDGSWYLTSLFTGFLALASMAWLGSRYGMDIRWASAAAFLYVCLPVCIRYFHWATGRGLFLALMPLAWVALLEPAPRRSWPGVAAAGSLLLLSHKTALVAVPLLVFVRLAAVGVPRRRAPALFLAGAFLAAAVLAGIAARPGTGRMATVGLAAAGRLGWTLAAVLPALWFGAARLQAPAPRRLFLGVTLAFPMVFMRDMYGTLILAAPLTLLVTDGLRTVAEKFSPRHRAMIVTMLAVITLAGAIGVTVKRSREAMPPALHAAAEFIDRRDPEGPFQIVAPGRASGQIRAYTHGSRSPAVYGKSARVLQFSVSLSGLSDVQTVRQLISALRHLVRIEAPELVWHDPSLRVYYVRVDGRGQVPSGAACIYDRDGVAVWLVRENR